MGAAFAVPGQILDGMAPHVWQGPTAAEDWYRDVLIEGKGHGASGYFAGGLPVKDMETAHRV